APAAVVDAVSAAVQEGRLPPDRLREAARRVLRVRHALALGDSSRAAARLAAGAAPAGEVAEDDRLALARELAGARSPLVADSLLHSADPAGPWGVVWPPAPVLEVVAPTEVAMDPGLGSRIDTRMRAALADSVFSGA